MTARPPPHRHLAADGVGDRPVVVELSERIGAGVVVPIVEAVDVDRRGANLSAVAHADPPAHVAGDEARIVEVRAPGTGRHALFARADDTAKLQAAPDEEIPMFREEDIHVVVVGGETNGYWRIMGCTYQKTVSVDEWR